MAGKIFFANKCKFLNYGLGVNISHIFCHWQKEKIQFYHKKYFQLLIFTIKVGNAKLRSRLIGPRASTDFAQSEPSSKERRPKIK